MIVRMKKFFLFFPSGKEDEFLREIQKLRIVEIHRLPSDFGFQEYLKKSIPAEEKLRKVEFLLDLIKRIEGKKPEGKILLTKRQEEEIVKKFPLDEIYERFMELDKILNKNREYLDKIKGKIEELKEFSNLDIPPATIYKLKNFSHIFFSANRNQEKKLEKLAEDYSLEKIKEDKGKSFYIILFPKEEKEKVEKYLAGINVKIYTIKPYHKKIDEILEKLERIKENTEKEIRRIENEISKVTEWKNQLLVISDHIQTEIERYKTIEKISSTNFLSGFSGWIKEKEIERFKRIVEEKIPESYLVFQDPEEDEEVPVALENSPLIQPFEVVTDLYGRPVYKGIDPTGPLTPFFLICFAFCLTDAGYGLLLILLYFILSKRFRYYPAVLKFLKLLFYSGIATFIIGAFTGGWFGNTVERMPEGFLIKKILEKITILNPLESGQKATLFLALALLIGYIQILWGVFLKFFHSVKTYSFKKSQEPFSVLLLHILFPVIILMFIKMKNNIFSFLLPKFLITLFILNLLYLMYLKASTQKEIMLKIFWAFYGVYTIFAGNLLGDILSYSRLFGLGLTTAVLALVVDEMVFLVRNIPYLGFIIAGVVFIIGHFGNLVINLLGGYVHTSRLQYLEFFTKFFEGGGRPFIPFGEVRNHTILSVEK
ncbi:MAG: hypothetical protein DRP67_04440 [Candidatus Omnitrophota bacterium]|nr:MAG: hypothetical protein DRP67_04440 [Candidatus Omnitrophota bacterium]